MPEQRGRLASLGRRNHTDGSGKSALPCRFAHPRQPNGYELFARRVPVAGNALVMTGCCRRVGHRWAPPVPPSFLPGLMPNLLPTSSHRPIRCRGAPCIGLSPHCNIPRFPPFPVTLHPFGACAQWCLTSQSSPSPPRILPGRCQHAISDRVSVPKRPRGDPWSLEPASPLKLASLPDLTCFVGGCSLWRRWPD